MEHKRSRGRPKGTTLNDARYLDEVADILIRNPSLKKTPTIEKIATKHFPEQDWEKVRRRLLRKWNNTADERLEAAKERHAELRRETSQCSETSCSNRYDIRTIFRRFDSAVNPPSLRAMNTALNRMQQLQDLVDPPLLRQFRRQQELFDRISRATRFP
ncbi:hypothetical protein [Thalassobius sp. I31.1]|uniref:hypothetical protein n=1 Tax=Thalassobius sp. I31.1 TaxID=2109912 RepID=UPI0013005678|nr:hypothetical protein [Thalassobius sp. I31.1]